MKMTTYEKQRLVNKLLRMAHELEHDNNNRISDPDMRAEVKLYEAAWALREAADKLMPF
jgi:hypothetical protein